MRYTIRPSPIVNLRCFGGLTALFCKTFDPVLFAYCPPNIDLLSIKGKKEKKMTNGCKKKKNSSPYEVRE